MLGMVFVKVRVSQSLDHMYSMAKMSARTIEKSNAANLTSFVPECGCVKQMKSGLPLCADSTVRADFASSREMKQWASANAASSVVRLALGSLDVFMANCLPVASSNRKIRVFVQSEKTFGLGLVSFMCDSTRSQHLRLETR